jgi:hypothetical protein
LRGWRKVGLVAVTVLVALEGLLGTVVGLGDPPLAMRDPVIEYRLVPDKTYHRFGNRITINSHGMRGERITDTAGASERRVMLIGDSVVYGDHHLDQEETIAYRMQNHLKDMPELSGCRLAVLPAAASSWGPVNQAAFLAEIGLLDADVALMIVSAHDLYDTPDASAIPYRTRPSLAALDDAAQIVGDRIKSRFSSDTSEGAPIELRRAQSLDALENLVAQLKSGGVAVTLVYHPDVMERQTGFSGERAVFADWAAAQDVAFVTLENAALAEPGMYHDLIHPAAPGADKIAEGLADLARGDLRPC